MSAIGAGNNPIYVGPNGDAKASTETIGSDTKPLKMVGGVLQPIGKELHDKTIVTVVDYGDQTADILAEIVVDGVTYTIHDKAGGGSAFVVTFKDWDSAVLKQEPVLKGGNATPPSNPTREGYTFASWSGTYTNVQKDETVVATYNINKYTVTFKLNGGNISGSTSDVTKSDVSYGTTIGSIKPSNPSRTQTAQYTYTFNGWDKSDSTTVVGNTTVTAQWTPSTRYYDIIWKNNGGTQLRKDNLAYGSTPSYGSTPTAENQEAGKTYTFKGWTPTISTVTGAATYTAEYTTGATTFSVYFNPNGGTINGSTSTYTKTGVAYNTKLSDVPPPTATRADTPSYTYSFYGWGTSTSTSSKVDPATITLKGSATYYALWTATPVSSKYTVTFNPDGGKIDGSTSSVVKTDIESGTMVSAIPPPADTSMSKDQDTGYTYAFNGWSKSSGGTKITPSSTSVTSNLTLYALWTPTARQYAIQFFNSTKANVKTSTSLYGPNNVAYGTTPSYGGTATSSLKPTDAETGKTYSFTGWKRTTDGGTGIKTVSGAEQYYAQYTSSTDTYTVTFKPNGGKLNGSTSDQSKSVAYGTNLSTADTYTKARDAVASGTYAFKGWSESSSGSVITTDPQITSAKTFYAIWELTKYKYTVRFFYKLGSSGTQTQIGDDQTVEYGSAATAPTKPTITGWTEGAWNPSSFSSITANTDVVSTYTINSHTLTITPRNTVSGGTAPTSTEVTTSGGGKINYGTVVTPSASVKSDYTNNWAFTNFKDASNNVITSVTMPDSDVTIYADFTPKYSVKFFKIVNGTKTQIGDTQYITRGGSATAPTKPTVEGYTAGDWVGTYTNVTSNQEVTCTYTIITCKVTFSYYNGETAKTSVSSVDYGTSYTSITKPTDTTRTGYNFSKWSDPSPSTAINSSGQVIGDCVVTAQYEEIKIWMLATNSTSNTTTGTNPVIYSEDNGATWKTGAQLSARHKIGYSATGKRFLLASTAFAPNNTSNYGVPWYNSGNFNYNTFTNSKYASTSIPHLRTTVHDKVCIAGNPSGKWVIGTGVSSEVEAGIYYSTDNGQTFNMSTWTSDPSATYFNGYFTQALFHGDICIVTGNCPQWEVSTDGGKTFTTNKGSMTNGPLRLIKTNDRFISCGSCTNPTGTAMTMDYMLFSNTSTLTHVASSSIGVGGTQTSLVVSDMCYDSAHKTLIMVDKNNVIYYLDVSSSYNFLKWVQVGSIPSSGTFKGLRYGNGIAMIIRYVSGTFNIITSSDGGKTWALKTAYSVSSRNINDFICGE